MNFPQPLIPARLVRRYKRFLADVRLESGSTVTVHCPNTGSMMGCVEADARVFLSRSRNVKRKYPFTWEIVEVHGGTLVGINTGRTNGLVREAVENGTIVELRRYGDMRQEVPYGTENSRIDFLFGGKGGAEACYVEVKNVTAAVRAGVALFPDAVTVRGTRHLRELTRQVQSGARAMVLFCVQRGDVDELRPADEIDPAYGEALRNALTNGVEAVAYRAHVGLTGIRIKDRIPVVCP